MRAFLPLLLCVASAVAGTLRLPSAVQHLLSQYTHTHTPPYAIHIAKTLKDLGELDEAPVSLVRTYGSQGQEAFLMLHALFGPAYPYTDTHTHTNASVWNTTLDDQNILFYSEDTGVSVPIPTHAALAFVTGADLDGDNARLLAFFQTFMESSDYSTGTKPRIVVMCECIRTPIQPQHVTSLVLDSLTQAWSLTPDTVTRGLSLSEAIDVVVQTIDTTDDIDSSVEKLSSSLQGLSSSPLPSLLSRVKSSMSSSPVVASDRENMCMDGCTEAAVEALQVFTDSFAQLGDTISNNLVQDFGATVDALSQGAIQDYEAAIAPSYAGSQASITAKHVLERDMCAYVRPLHRRQIQKLRQATLEKFRAELKDLRMGPSMPEALANAQKEALAFYDKFVKHLHPKKLGRGICAWRADLERSQVAQAMSDFSLEKVQTGRVQGTVLSGGKRKGISLSFHILFPRFLIRDFSQDSFGAYYDKASLAGTGNRAEEMLITNHQSWVERGLREAGMTKEELEAHGLDTGTAPNMFVRPSKLKARPNLSEFD